MLCVANADGKLAYRAIPNAPTHATCVRLVSTAPEGTATGAIHRAAVRPQVRLDSPPQYWICRLDPSKAAALIDGPQSLRGWKRVRIVLGAQRWSAAGKDSGGEGCPTPGGDDCGCVQAAGSAMVRGHQRSALAQRAAARATPGLCSRRPPPAAPRLTSPSPRCVPQSHTIVLVQTTASRATRTFHDYEGVGGAMDGRSPPQCILAHRRRIHILTGHL